MKKELAMPDFVQMERDILAFWKENKCFEKMREQNAKTGKYFSFLDGPITANNKMAVHHVWGRSLKDILLRYKSICGFDSHYQNGFDGQGLWVEVNMEKELGLGSKKDIINYGLDKFTEASIARVKHFSEVISNQSIRLGQWMDWDHSYYTNSDENITAIWYFLKECHKKGWLIEKYRPMPWCSHCGTSLSEHELLDSYSDMVHTAIFFKLPILDTDMDMLVWTTTPWTLSSNVAIAVNSKLNYSICRVKSSDRLMVVCSDAIKALKDDLVKVEKVVSGAELVGKSYETCFPEFDQQLFEHKIVDWDMVDATEGSGAVHIAPGCHADDFELGQKLGLPNVCPVDEAGVFYDDFGFLAGKDTSEVANIIFDDLKQQGKLYYTHEHSHRYPICWRCKKPLIFRLSKEWYLRADEIRPQLIEAVETVEWQPEFMKKRMLDWLTNMGDWNISRKRFYGLPLPFYRCEECGELVIVGSLDELKALSSSEQVEKLPHLHRPYIDDIQITCPKCHAKVKRVEEVGDCWLDAGITPFSTQKYFDDKEFWKRNFPADCVIEMKEQIRLWFYSMLFMSVTLEGRAPYKKVVGFATLVAEDGSKFSKSGPNNIPFDDLVEKVGADVLRYIFASNNMVNDTRFGVSVCDDTRRKLLGLWNSYIFFNTYAVLDEPKLNGFTPLAKDLTVTDRWLIQRINKFVNDAKMWYDANENYLLTKEFEIIIDELSNWYIRLNRRRFWKSDDKDDKLVAYFALYYALKRICQVMAPIMPFVCEYIWQNMVRAIEPHSAESIMQGGFATADYKIDDEFLIENTLVAQQIITIAQRLRNEKQIKIKQPLKTMFVSGDENLRRAVSEYNQIILDELNIKNLVVELDVNKFNEPFLTINFRTAGAVLKNQVQQLKNELNMATDESMSDYVNQFNNGKVTIGEFKDLDSTLFVMNFRPKKEYVIASENGITIVLDITIDESLLLEGLCREVIRQIQLLRKEANYKIEQRVEVYLATDSKLIQDVLNVYKEKIMQEILAVKELESSNNADIIKDMEIDGEILKIALKK